MKSQERVSFKIAKSLKDAGYPQEWYNTEYYYTVSGELKRCDDYEGNNNEDIMFYQRNAVPAPFALDVCLWLWREKGIFIKVFPALDKFHFDILFIEDDVWQHGGFIVSEYSDPEDALIGGINSVIDEGYLINKSLEKKE